MNLLKWYFKHSTKIDLILRTTIISMLIAIVLVSLLDVAMCLEYLGK